MAAFKFDSFNGLFPRIPESHLPPTAATLADNCDFGYAELRNTKGDFFIQSLNHVPASIYTDDGTKFYSWGSDVNAARSPLSRDTFNRLYYTNGIDFRVTSRDGMSSGGGEPGSSYRVGVPKPTVAPTLTVPALPSLTNATLTAKFHYEFGGVKYQEQDASLSVITANSKWSFTPPDKAIAESEGGTTSGNPYEYTATWWYNNDLDQWVSFSSDITTITIISNNLIRDGNGVYHNTTQIKDDLGAIHEVETLFSLAQYGKLNSTSSSSTASATATPDQAIPVIRITAVDNTTQAQIFDCYSSNSSLGTKDALVELSIAKDAAPALTYTVTLNTGLKEADKETRAYVYTYVNIYNEEGPPSPPASVTTSPTLDVTVVATRDALTASYALIKEIRIYRTPTGSEIADYFYVGSISVLAQGGFTFSFIDNVKASGLNEPIASTYYYPPDPALVGITALPNGILMAWKGNELHFSDAYKPWSWPPSYVKTASHNIVGAIAIGSGALVTTIGQPFMISGVSPDSMTERKIDSTQAGLSKWSLANVGGLVAYASNDGIVVVDGSQATLAYSEQFFTRDKWRELYRNGFSSMRFAVWDGRLIVYSSNGAFTAFMIRLDEAKGSMTRITWSAQCTFVSPVSDQCYSVNGNGLYQFAGGGDIQATWKSREMVLKVPVNFGFAQAVCTGNWTISFFTDDVLRHTKVLSAGKTDFRLPSGFKSDRWKIQLTGTGRFRELRVAVTARELAEA